MSQLAHFTAGDYQYIPAVFQYSAGVVADPGFTIERVTFRDRSKLADGFRRVEAHLAAIGRPPTAFCACELRSPAPFSEAGFIAFNEGYCSALERWGIYDVAHKLNPVARSNVCPVIGPPSEPCLHAFCYTVPSHGHDVAFVVSGSGEAPEGKGSYGTFIVRRGETSPDAIAAKAQAVIGELGRRLNLLGRGWAETSATQVYTVHEFRHVYENQIAPRISTAAGLTWHLARPPVVELEFEMDCRCIPVERVI
jgi:hypothetical protein